MAERTIELGDAFDSDECADRLSIPRRAQAEELSESRRAFRTSFGNVLAVREYGDPDGTPVLFFHGTGAHFHPMGLHAPGRHYGFRIIVPTRPGCADSQFVEWTHLQYAEMMRELLDDREIDRAVFAGISGGGPTLMASALRLTDRAAAVVALACASPVYQDPARVKELGRADRFYARLGTRLPLSVFAAFYGVIGVLERRISSPQTFSKLFAGSLGPADQALFRNSDCAYLLMRDFQELFKHGSRGPAFDALTVYRDWGFDVSQIATHVDVFQGRDDKFVPEVFTGYYADRLTDATVVMVSGLGHMGHMAYGYRTLNNVRQILDRS